MEIKVIMLNVIHADLFNYRMLLELAKMLSFLV